MIRALAFAILFWAAALLASPVAAQSSDAPRRSAAEIYRDPPDIPDWAERFAACRCIENADGRCMSFHQGVYPYRQNDDGISGESCTSGCMPGFSDVYGYTEQTKRELAECRVNWGRLRRERQENIERLGRLRREQQEQLRRLAR